VPLISCAMAGIEEAASATSVIRVLMVIARFLFGGGREVRNAASRHAFGEFCGPREMRCL
jgi:hypothetical protein